MRFVLIAALLLLPISANAAGSYASSPHKVRVHPVTGKRLHPVRRHPLRVHPVTGRRIHPVTGKKLP
jgi:hypothetical protein